METHATTTPVLVVGAGPAGLVTAIGLAVHGVRSLVVERHLGLSIFPRATGISPRSMEIMRSWGIEEQVRAREFSALPLGRVAPTLTAEHGVVVPLGFPTREEAAAVSPTASAIAPQDAFEPVLLAKLRALGGDVRFGTELVTIGQDAEGVTALIEDRFSGEQTRVRARYVVGADGAASRVRHAVGVGMVGPDHLEEYLTTLFHAPMTERLGGPRYALNMIAGPAGPGVVLPTSDDDRWVFARPWDPAAERLADYPPARVAELIRAAAGIADLPVAVRGVMSFSFAAQVARSYRNGRVLLVGDAAHRITPRGGTGMNTAIHDAHNLAWKLAYVVRGVAGEGLLQTYEAERRPVGEANAARSAVPMEQSTPVDPIAADLGVGYGDGAFVPERRPREEPSTMDGQAGGRAPHVWLDGDGRQMSTLDLFGRGLTLLAGPDGGAWAGAAARIAASSGAPLRIHRVAAPGFPRAYGIGRGGAVLVRPDGYVAWRSRGAGETGDLRHAVAVALGAARPGPERTISERPAAAVAAA